MNDSPVKILTNQEKIKDLSLTLEKHTLCFIMRICQ